MTGARLASVASARPAPMDHAELWDGFFAHHYGHNRTAERVWTTAGIRTRHGAVDPRNEDISQWGTAARMRRYLTDALPLGKEAVAGALGRAGLAGRDVGLFAVVSCTGYATPGLDILLARDLDMGPEVQRLFLGHMGCYAALPGLGAVADFVRARRRPAVLLCVELPSLHLQPATDDVSQMVAHALFSDAAAAVVVLPDRSGLQILDTVAQTDPASSELMTWDVTDLGFRMGLSPKVPDVLARHALPTVQRLLAARGLATGEVAGWAVHPGGRRILEVVSTELGLADGALAASFATLLEDGNCSSATVLLVLERMLADRTLTAGDSLVAMAFGPGLTLYATLFQQS